jgi:6-phosphogluconolactonase
MDKKMSHYVYVPILSSILVYAMDPATGNLTLKHEVPAGGNGSALATGPKQEVLYVSNGNDSGSFISSFRIDQSTGGLTALGSVPIEGNACHMSTDRSGRYLLSAYYSDGMAVVHEIGEDGSLVDPPVDRHETELYAHFAATHPSNRFAFVPHVESANRIYQYHFDAATGKMTPNEVEPELACSAGHGPRHLAFHPALDIVYADNEQGSSVTAYAFDPAQGTLRELQTVSTLPPEGHENNSNAQLHLHPSGRFIYATNRGHDSIAMFSIDAETGLITSLGQQPSEATPRPFAIDPDGGYLFAGGDRSKRLASYRIRDDGTLEPFGEPIQFEGNPGWVLSLKFD